MNFKREFIVAFFRANYHDTFIGLLINIQYHFYFVFFDLSSMRKSLIFCSLIASQSIVSCTYLYDHIPGIYRVDIQQGNIIEQGMIDQLKPGMSKKQVLYILGSPMAENTFHKNRWDYIYINQPSGEDKVQHQFSLFFENDVVVGVQGDFRPNSVTGPIAAKETSVDVPKRDLDKTMWEKITTMFGLLSPDTTNNPLRSTKPEQAPKSNTDNLPL